MEPERILLPEESVICGLKGGDYDGFVLTNDGYIAKIQEHDFKGVTRLFKMLHAKDITSIETKELSPIRLIQILVLIHIICAGMVMAYLPFEQGIDVFWHGNPEYEPPSDEAHPFSSLRSIIFSAATFGMFLPFIAHRVLKDGIADGIRIIIGHSNGNMEMVSFGKQWYLPVIFYGICFGFALVGQPTTEGMGILIARLLNPFFGLFILLIITIGFFKIDKQNEEKDEFPVVKMKEFREKLRTFLDVDGVGEGEISILPLSVKLESELKDIRNQLDSHEQMLKQVVVKFPDMFAVPSPWLGVTTIRASTEILLDHRIKQIDPKDTNVKRDMNGCLSALKSLDQGFNNKMHGTIDSLRVLGNAATHSMEASNEDYLSALQKFVRIVSWHVDNKPVPRIS